MTLTIGNTEIPYLVRYSSKARRIRIIVTPDNVEVVAPENVDDDVVISFVNKKRKWVYTKREELRERALAIEGVPRFITGAKIMHRGRRMKLHVTSGHVNAVRIAYKNGFNVTVPERMPEAEREPAIEVALTEWQQDRLQTDARAIVKQYSSKVGESPTGIRVRKLKGYWGSCG